MEKTVQEIGQIPRQNKGNL